ncbi:uracil-DNA glycosylase [Mycoplasma sp. Pen4]|uniref:uracil-DNA glycosylase n=1 Tax=Mycoplasma sp. Pen4 TaxID=640330 RepID=UPI0016544247|nr:uracil-DNA glycosylase [Mycoplasma sp. Pen4]QNM93871.1 uracil-DNA glycosylase [Mycoplasma sp. Pen4]
MKNSFIEILQSEGKKPYFDNIINGLREEGKKTVIYPEQVQIFRPFDYFQVAETKVIILGQDPYHTYGYADGLAFSTGNNKLSPSLRNIFKELKKDYPKIKLDSTDLTPWAKQGVLLLNTVLTVSHGEPNSHKNFGWQSFTKKVIQEVVKVNPNVILVLLGKEAQKFAKDIEINPDNVIATSHPSPYSYKKGFENSGIFKLINKKLKKHNEQPIDWNLEGGK